MALTPKQREAVESWNRGDVCVVAGPGSGKTRVLVERFQWLVEKRGVPAQRILAITFTEKAATEMRRRLVEAFPAGSTTRQEVERAHISTIDAFCAKLLRENAIDAEVDPEFRVLDQWEADFELRQAIEETLEREYGRRPERAREFLLRFGSRDVYGSLFGLYLAIRSAGVSVEEAGRITGAQLPARQRWQALLEAYEQLATLGASGWNEKQRRALDQALEMRARLRELAAQPFGAEHFAALGEIGFNLGSFKLGSEQREMLRKIKEELAPACQAALLLEVNTEARRWFLEMLAGAERRYRDEKRRASALDYADLEEAAIRLLEKTGRRVAASFDFVLMDEFQDTNPLQAKLAELLRSRDNFFAVGDINQSIYGFRHADPEVFREYRDRTERGGGHIVTLVENFRSRQGVLDAVRTIMAGAEGVEPRELVAKSEFRPDAGPCLEVLGVQAGDGDEALKLEAKYVAARIQELCGTLELQTGPARYQDFAVLLRTTVNVRVFERVLRAWGVPCQVSEGRGFYEMREIVDLIQFLRALLNPLDEISLATVLRSPLAGVSDETLVRLKLAGGSLMEGIRRGAGGVPTGETQKLERFRALLDRYRAERDEVPLDRLLGRLLAETGYEAWLLEQPGGLHMSANVRKLLALARRFHAGGLAGLQAFVDRVEALERDEVREAEAEPPEQTADAVRLMTVHAAKGLEFPVVFLPAINRPPRRDSDPVSFSADLGVGMCWRDPAAGEVEKDAIAEAIAADRKLHNREETQRLFYVAMTRAKERLALSASFGGTVRVEQWAKNLAENLDIDWGRIDNEIHEVTLRGIPARLLQTSQDLLAFAGPAPEAAEAPAVTWVERAAAEEQADTAVTASAVSLFAVCPRKYYLSRYLGFDAARAGGTAAAGEDDAPPPERDEMDASEFGRRVHALLAGARPREQADREALRLVENFESSAWGRRAAAASRAEREQDFLISLGGRLLRGQIDLWFEQGGEIVVADYKTDEVTASEAAGRAGEYELQLRLYALAVERITGARPRRAVLYFLRPNVAVEIALDEASLAAAQAKVEELFQAQSRVDFPLRAGKHCFRCPHFRGICPAQVPAPAQAAARPA
ncbi:MAG TPA: UvrD-helicase domain-containing protein [Bryobacterales bacterium]|nr:UvrD-helicase domain-containing protein [Bryobacterales bacterium]